MQRESKMREGMLREAEGETDCVCVYISERGSTGPALDPSKV